MKTENMPIKFKFDRESTEVRFPYNLPTWGTSLGLVCTLYNGRIDRNQSNCRSEFYDYPTLYSFDREIKQQIRVVVTYQGQIPQDAFVYDLVENNLESLDKVKDSLKKMGFVEEKLEEAIAA